MAQRENGWEPIKGEISPVIDYSDMAEYLRSWPDKLVAFVTDRLVDDNMAAFTRELYEYICEADRNGPAFEEWRKT